MADANKYGGIQPQIDLGAMYNAIRADTKMVYLCNPNNPIPSIIEKKCDEGFYSCSIQRQNGIR